MATKTPTRAIDDNARPAEAIIAIAQTLVGNAKKNIVVCPVGVYFGLSALWMFAKKDTEGEVLLRKLVAEPSNRTIDDVCGIINECEGSGVTIYDDTSAAFGIELAGFVIDLLARTFRARLLFDISKLATLELRICKEIDAKWTDSHKFRARDVDFHVEGEKKRVPGFAACARFDYGRGAAFDVVKVPLGDAKSCYVYIARTTTATISEILDAHFSPTNPVRVSLAMPRLYIKNDLALTNTFVPWASECGDVFRHVRVGAAPDETVKVDIDQVCDIEVNERGVTAKSVTSVRMGFGSKKSAEAPIDFTVDKPFTFLIVPAGARFPLFCLKCFNPTQ